MRTCVKIHQTPYFIFCDTIFHCPNSNSSNFSCHFSSKCGSLFSVMRDNCSVLFHLKLYMLSTKGTHQMQIFRLSTARIKINQIPCHFSSHESVFP